MKLLRTIKIKISSFAYNHSGILCTMLRWLYLLLIKIRYRKLARRKEHRYGSLHENETIYLIKYDKGNAGLFAYVNLVLLRLTAAKEQGLTPVVDIGGDALTDDPGCNSWEAFFEQPAGVSVDEAMQSARVLRSDEYHPVGGAPIHNLAFLNGLDGRLSAYCDLVASQIRPNEHTQRYLDDGWRSLDTEGRTVLAVISRGTDFKKQRPLGHAIQPEAEMLIERAGEIMESRSIDLLFLKTEERSVREMFAERFGERLRTFDVDYFDGYESSVGAKDQDDQSYQDFLRAYIERSVKRSALDLNREYLRSIYAASKCDYLLAGINGGSIGAVLLNGGRYREKFITYLGYYC